MLLDYTLAWPSHFFLLDIEQEEEEGTEKPPPPPPEEINPRLSDLAHDEGNRMCLLVPAACSPPPLIYSTTVLRI